MNENMGHFTLYGKSPLLQLVITLLIAVVLGGAIFLLLFIAGLLFSGIGLSTISENFITDMGKENIYFFRYLMIVQSIAIMIIPAIIVRNMLLPDNQKSLNDFHLPRFNEAAIVVLLALCILPINSITGELNSAMQFPDWLTGLEEWMRSKEDEAAKLTRLLMPSDSGGAMFLDMFFIAALPAISEELFFRGVLQRIFYGFFKSPHTSIWITAGLFSAIHLQFYGFVPRLILGLSFGYLYFWGRTLWLPVIAHFVNNGTAVVAEYFQNAETVSSVPDVENWTRFLILPAPVFISVIILAWFRNKYYKDLPEKVKNFPHTGHDQI